MLRPVATLVSIMLASTATSHAQIATALERWVSFPVAQVPFGPGERMEYKVTYGIMGKVGESSLGIPEIDTIRGAPSYRIDFRLSGSIPFAKVNDHFQSWMDVEQLQSHRFDQNVHEVKYKRHRILDFHPDSGIWRRSDNGEMGVLAHPRPLDDLSFLYFVRTLPLEVGVTYELDRYFKSEGNPVIVRVLRKEKIKVPAGEFETVVVRPIIRTDGMFSEGGEAEVYFTDDDRRILVQLKTKLAIARINLQLTSWTPGERLVGQSAEPDGTSR